MVRQTQTALGRSLHRSVDSNKLDFGTEKFKKFMEEQIESIKSTENIFCKRKDAISKVTNETIEVTNKTEIIDKNFVSLEKMINNISYVIDQNATASKEVVA